MTNSTAEKILIAENDPVTCDLIGRQTLQPFGYRVHVVPDGSSAIQQIFQFQPDILIINLNLPGLSGKDVLVALTSQGISIPAIVIAQKGQESAILQAFRTGASDYLLLPVREAEVLACVERAQKQVQEKHTREALSMQIKQTNAELQRKVHEMSTIYSIGRSVISITDQNILFGKIIEAGLSATEADMGWLSLKNDRNNSFLLAAQRNLPASLAEKIGQPIEDGLGSLVSMSLEPLSIHGTALEKFKVAVLGKSAMVVPIKVKNQAIGLITLIRKAEKPFSTSDHALAGAIADYASISLVNARLFRALSNNAESARKQEQLKNEQFEQMRMLVESETISTLDEAKKLIGEGSQNFTGAQQLALRTLHDKLNKLIKMVEKTKNQADINKKVRQ